MAEWASRKGFPVKDFSRAVPVSQYHTQCAPSDGTRAQWKPPICPMKQQPPASSPWTIFTGLHPEKPDLRDSIIMMERSSRQLEYVTKWDRTPHRLPDLPTDVLKRVLFPKAFPSRISSSRHFEPWDITEVQHRRHPWEKTTSPWTEVAMHLAEVLEPGHYWSWPPLILIYEALTYDYQKGDSLPPHQIGSTPHKRHTLPDAVLPKGEKNLGELGHPSPSGSLHFPRSPSGTVFGIQVSSCQRQVWNCQQASLFFFTLRSASHHDTHVHTGLRGPRAAKEAPFILTLHCM